MGNEGKPWKRSRFRVTKSMVSEAEELFLRRGVPLEKCPDNDGHNVDTTCGLPMTIPVALAAAHLSPSDARKEAFKGHLSYVTHLNGLSDVS